MRAFLTLIALCMTLFLIGCESTNSRSDSMSASPGAMGESCPVTGKAGNCPKADSCCGTCGGDASPGAMSDMPADCSSKCSGKTCPVTGQPVSPGAMNDKPADCSSKCSGKTCPVTGQPVSPGAMNDKPADCSSKSDCGISRGK